MTIQHNNAILFIFLHVIKYYFVMTYQHQLPFNLTCPTHSASRTVPIDV